ncbi:hypothetical protein RIR_e38165_A0A2N0NGJ0_9GLOM [Rhizophagus irregularis DAOM 181602=DAOM 197198]|nr:hypothetical protein RIR_e38165_A0A2N0NGJ0_9GLOM [Rhizophagus irregularis DAOM 181602=DAOM 197198]
MICCHNNYITPEIMWPFKHAKNADKLKCEFVDFYYFFDRFSLLILFALTKFLFMFIFAFLLWRNSRLCIYIFKFK